MKSTLKIPITSEAPRESRILSRFRLAVAFALGAGVAFGLVALKGSDSKVSLKDKTAEIASTSTSPDAGILECRAKFIPVLMRPECPQIDDNEIVSHAFKILSELAARDVAQAIDDYGLTDPDDQEALLRAAQWGCHVKKVNLQEVIMENPDASVCERPIPLKRAWEVPAEFAEIARKLQAGDPAGAIQAFDIDSVRIEAEAAGMQESFGSVLELASDIQNNLAVSTTDPFQKARIACRGRVHMSLAALSLFPSQMTPEDVATLDNSTTLNHFSGAGLDLFLEGLTKIAAMGTSTGFSESCLAAFLLEDRD